MPRMTFGLALDFGTRRAALQQVIDEYVPLLELAESLGFKSVWAGEVASVRPGPSHVPSPLLVLAALAPRTELLLGTGVLLLPMWHPLKLAYDCAILDQLSGGRFILGVGAASPSDWARFGVDRATVGQRMDEMLAALRALWSGEEGFHGKVISIERGIWPRPLQEGGPPIWVGGKVGRSATRAARLGDAWYAATQYPFKVVADGAARYTGALLQEGKTAEGAIISANRLTCLAEDDSRAFAEGGPFVERVLDSYARYGALFASDGTRLERGAALLEKLAEDTCLVGSPEVVVARLERYSAAGVTHIQMRVAPGDMPADLVERTVRLAGERVLPRFA